MKRFLLVSLFIFFMHIAFSQKAFEGTIIYNTHSSGRMGKQQDGELVVVFGKNAIKLKFKENGKNFEKDEVLVKLDSGKVYTLNNKDSTFRIESKIRSSVKKEKLQPQTILGYATTPLEYTGHSSAEIVANLMPNSDIILQVADSLYYPVPEKYQRSEYLIMVSNNRIVLSAQCYMNNDRSGWEPANEDTDSVLQGAGYKIELTAKEIIPQIFADNEMQIPVGYKKYVYNYVADSTMMVDSVKMMVDSIKMADSIVSPRRNSVRGATKSKQKKKTTKVVNPAKKPD